MNNAWRNPATKGGCQQWSLIFDVERDASPSDNKAIGPSDCQLELHSHMKHILAAAAESDNGTLMTNAAGEIDRSSSPNQLIDFNIGDSPQSIRFPSWATGPALCNALTESAFLLVRNQ